MGHSSRIVEDSDVWVIEPVRDEHKRIQRRNVIRVGSADYDLCM